MLEYLDGGSLGDVLAKVRSHTLTHLNHRKHVHAGSETLSVYVMYWVRAFEREPVNKWPIMLQHPLFLTMAM